MIASGLATVGADVTFSPQAANALRTLLAAPQPHPGGGPSGDTVTVVSPQERTAPTATTLPVLPRLQLSHATAHYGALPAQSPVDIEITGLLGEGGMGRVELGHQPALDRAVAVKRVRPDRVCPLALRALLHEAKVTGSLEHPNVIPVHMLGVDADGQPLLVMKRVAGTVWRELIVRPDHPAWQHLGQDRERQHLDILLAVCNGVQFAHKRGIVHRDLKTENVMVGEDGEVYVLDWGIALRLGMPPSQELAGTPAYMAPEMLRGTAEIDERSDIFLLGAMLHEVLTGQTRHRGATTLEVLRAAAVSDPQVYGPQVPAELAEICNKATAAAQADRYTDVAALRSAIDGYLHHRGSIAVAARATATLVAMQAAVAQVAALTDRAGTDPDTTHRTPELARALEMQRTLVRKLATEAGYGFG